MPEITYYIALHSKQDCNFIKHCKDTLDHQQRRVLTVKIAFKIDINGKVGVNIKVYLNSNLNYLLACKIIISCDRFSSVRFIERIAASTSHRSSISAFRPKLPRKCGGEMLDIAMMLSTDSFKNKISVDINILRYVVDSNNV